MTKSNYIEYEKIKKKIEEITNKEVELFLEKAKLIKKSKMILKQCIDNKEITIDTLFKLI